MKTFFNKTTLILCSILFLASFSANASAQGVLIREVTKCPNGPDVLCEIDITHTGWFNDVCTGIKDSNLSYQGVSNQGDLGNCSNQKDKLSALFSQIIGGSPNSYSQYIENNWCRKFIENSCFNPSSSGNGSGSTTPSNQTNNPGSLDFGESLLGNPLGGSGVIGTDGVSYTFNDIIAFILRYVLLIGSPIAVLALIWAGFQYVWAQGNPEKIGRAHKILMWTILGIILLFGSWALATAISNTICKIVNGDQSVCNRDNTASNPTGN